MFSSIWNQTPEENIFNYYKKSLLGNLVKLLKAINKFVIDEEKWEVVDKFMRNLEGGSIQLMSLSPADNQIIGNNLYLYQANNEILYAIKTPKGIIRDKINNADFSDFVFFDTLLSILNDKNPHTILLDTKIQEEVIRIISERGHIYPELYNNKFLYDMQDFIANPEASHPVFADLYINFKEKLNLLYLEIIKRHIEKIEKNIDDDLKQFLDPTNTREKFSESAEFIDASSTCKNFLALDLKNVKIDPKIKEFIHSNNHRILIMLMQSQALTTYKNCLKLNQTNIDAEIESIDKQIYHSDALTLEKLLTKKIVLENVRDNYLKLLPDIFHANNQLLHIIALMRYFEAILANFNNKFSRIEKIGQIHTKLGKAYRKFFRVTEDETLRKADKMIDDNELEKLGRDLIITALINALVNVNIVSDRDKFIERRLTMPHKNPKIYKDLDIDKLAEKLQKIVVLYQYSTIEQRIKTIQLKLEGIEPKGIGALEDVVTQVAANFKKQLSELKTEVKATPLVESNMEFTTAPVGIRSKRQKKRSTNLNKITRASSQFIVDKAIHAESEPIITRVYKPAKPKKQLPSVRNAFPSPLIKSPSDFSNDFNKFPFWEDDKSEIIINEPSQQKKISNKKL